MKLDCRICTPIQKIYRGCNAEPKEQFIFEKERLKRCPVKLIEPITLYYIKLFGYYEKGYLPCNGGILNQPAKLLDFFETIEEVLSEIKEGERERQNGRPHSRTI